MASFDRKPAGPTSNKKKNIMAGVLAAGLALVLVHQFTKAKPSDAAAPDAAGPAVVEATPESLDNTLLALADNPLKTGSLFSVEPPSPLDQAPDDPFQLSSAWREKLTKAVEPKMVAVVVSTPHEAAPGVKQYDPSGLKLTGIFRNNNRVYAVINGSIMTENDTVAAAKIIEIGDDRVVLQPLTGTSADRVELVIKPKLK